MGFMRPAENQRPFSRRGGFLGAGAVLLLAGGALQGQPQFTRGDSNLDGRVTLTDVNYLLDHLFKGTPSPRCLDAADADDNGLIDSGGLPDASYLLSWLFRTGLAPPPPFPLPGVDPTKDLLACADPAVTPPGGP